MHPEQNSVFLNTHLSAFKFYVFFGRAYCFVLHDAWNTLAAKHGHRLTYAQPSTIVIRAITMKQSNSGKDFWKEKNGERNKTKRKQRQTNTWYSRKHPKNRKREHDIKKQKGNNNNKWNYTHSICFFFNLIDNVTRPPHQAFIECVINQGALPQAKAKYTHKTTLSNCSPFSEGDIGDFCDSYHVRSGSSMLEQEVHLTCHLSPCFSHSPYERMWIFLHHNPSCSHGDWSSLKKFTRCSMKRLIPPVPRYKSELKLLFSDWLSWWIYTKGSASFSVSPGLQAYAVLPACEQTRSSRMALERWRFFYANVPYMYIHKQWKYIEI